MTKLTPNEWRFNEGYYRAFGFDPYNSDDAHIVFTNVRYQIKC